MNRIFLSGSQKTMYDYPLRDTVLEIDLDKLARNIRKIKSTLHDDTQYMAVVKADGYGHGVLEMMPTMIENGVSYLAVATLNEAVYLRTHGVELPVMILGNTPVCFLDLVAKYDISIAIVSKEHADAIRDFARDHGVKISVHVALDTGMHRIGLAWNDTESILEILKYPEFRIAGIFTHFTQTTLETDYAQFTKYNCVLKAIQKAGLPIPIRHVCSSQPTVKMPDCHLDMVRIGRVMYGLSAFSELPTEIIGTFRSKVVSLRHVDAGEKIGYSYIWTAKRPSIIATLPFGSVDGYSCQLIGKGEVSIHGVRVPVVGRVCMDQCMADVTDVPDIAVGDDVYVWGDGSHGEYTVTDLADIMGITRGELLARISRRVPKVYIKGGKVVSITDLV